MMTRMGVARVAAVVAALGAASTARAGHFGATKYAAGSNPCCDAQTHFASSVAQSQPCQTVVYDTVIEKRTQTCYKTVTETVMQPVTKTAYKDEVRTCYKTVNETAYKQVQETICKPVRKPSCGRRSTPRRSRFTRRAPSASRKPS